MEKIKICIEHTNWFCSGDNCSKCLFYPLFENNKNQIIIDEEEEEKYRPNGAQH